VPGAFAGLQLPGDFTVTATSIKDTERQADAINEQANKAERKLGH